MDQIVWHPGWNLIWFPAGIVGLLAPFFWKKYRLGYSAALSAVLAVALTFLSAHGEQPALGFWNRTPTSWVGYSLFFQSGKGGIGFAYREIIDLTPENLLEQTKSTELVLARAYSYPSFRDPIFKRWGFQLTIFGEPPRKKYGGVTHLWAFIMPIWFPIPFLLILPYLYLRRRILIPRYRGKHNLCRACGYSRDGIPSDRACPECGLVPALPKSSTKPDTPILGTGTAAETQEKQA